MEDFSAMNGLMDRFGLSMKLKKVPANPILGREDSTAGVHHYKCRLSKLGDEIDIYLSVDPLEGQLTLEDVLLMLAMDASGCQLLEGYQDCKDEWTSEVKAVNGAMHDLDDFWMEYDNRCRQTQKVRQFLGESVYNQLIQNFGFSNVFAGAF